MASQRKNNKRFKGFGIPIEVCMKFEKKAGFKPGQELTKKEAEKVTDEMVKALICGVADITLTSEEYELVAKEVKRNEERNR